MKCNSLLRVAITAAGLISSCALAQDAVSVDPKHHKVEFENDEVRVLRISFGPGETAPMHDHPCGIVVGIQDGTLEFGFPDGTSRAAPLKRGQVVTPKPIKHQVANKSSSAFEVILVELKKGGC